MNNSFKNSLNNEATNENKWAARLAYKCAICKKEFDNIQDRAECELACLKKQAEEKKLAAEKKKKEEQTARKKEVDDALAHAYKLKDQYITDYGSYVYTCDADDLDLTDLFDLFKFARRLP